MMRKHIGPALLLTLVFCLVQLMAAVSGDFAAPTWELRAPTGQSTATKAEVDALAAGQPASGYAAKTLRLHAEGRDGMTVMGLYTDEAHRALYHVELASGSFLLPDDIAVGRNAVVIDEAIALAFFRSNDVIGYPIQVNGQPYLIVGVSRAPKSLPAALSADAYARVYLPYAADQALDVIAVEAQEGVTAAVSRLSAAAQVNLAPYRALPYGEYHAALTQLGLPLGWAALAVLMVLAGTLAARLAAPRPGQALKSPRLWGTATFSAACLAGALLLARYDLILPTGYIPPDNVFDLTFYAKTFFADMRRFNTLPYPDGNLLMLRLLFTGGIHTTLSLMLLCLALPTGLMLGKTALHLENAALLAGIACLAGTGLGCLAALAMHLPVTLTPATMFTLLAALCLFGIASAMAQSRPQDALSSLDAPQ